MRRREFISLISSVASAWPLAAHAQQPAQELRRIGSIHNVRSENCEAFVQGLREAGLVDGQNIVLEARFYGGGVLERYDEYARELVALKCSVIFASNPYAIRAVLKATSTIPTVGIDLESDPRRERVGQESCSSRRQLYRIFSGYSRTGRQTNRTAKGGGANVLAFRRALGRNHRSSSIPRNRNGCPFCGRYVAIAPDPTTGRCQRRLRACGARAGSSDGHTLLTSDLCRTCAHGRSGFKDPAADNQSFQFVSYVWRTYGLWSGFTLDFQASSGLCESHS
jgi:hypothetical protein